MGTEPVLDRLNNAVPIYRVYWPFGASKMGVEMASMGCKGDLKRLESETASDVWREVTAPKRSPAVDRRAPGIAAACVSWGASNPVPGVPI